MSELETLYRLQQLDARIFELRAAMENHPYKEEVAGLRTEEEECSRQLSRAESSLQDAARRMARLEAEISGLDEKLAREEGKLFGGQVTNPKELRGLQAEVRSLRKQKDALETELLEEMESQDALRARAEELRKRHGELTARIEEMEAAIRAETGEMGAELEKLEKEREELSSLVAGDLLDLYDRLRAAKQNLAVVRVIDGVCQGCRVELPGKEYDRFLKSEGVFRCSNCGRILVR